MTYVSVSFSLFLHVKKAGMFFIFSKILLFLLSPLTWFLSLLLWAIITRNARRRKKLLILSAALLYLFSNSFLLDEAMRAWEVRHNKKTGQTDKIYDYGIVLGGVVSYYDRNFSQTGFNRSVDRLMQAIKLYRSGKIRKIVFTGGDASVLRQGFSEADIIKNYLSEIGINPDDMIFENSSRNTYENTRFVKLVLNPAKDDKLLIITSAYHIRRALGCFRKAGMYPDFHAADFYSGKRRFTPDHLLVPDTGALDRWALLLHEITGYIVYKIAGYC